MKYVVTLKFNSNRHEFNAFSELIKACKLWNVFRIKYVVKVVNKC